MALFGNRFNKRSLIHNTWTITAIVLLCLLVAGLFIYTFNVSLLLMAGIVLAVYLRLITDKLKRWTKWKDGICYLLSIVITLLLLTALFWGIGTKIQDQYTQLQKQWPTMKENLTSYIQKYPMLQNVSEKVLGANTVNNFMKDSADSIGKQNNKADTTIQKQNTDTTAAQATSSPTAVNSSSDTSFNQKGNSWISSLFRSTFGFLGDMYTILFLGIFLSAAPKDYVNGMVALLPQRGREKGRATLERIGDNLRKWFKGMVFSVLITFALTAIGLLLLKQDLWLILAISAGLLTFIPNFGPIIALIPAVLIGLLQGPETALYIALLYIGVQLVESNFITPFIQKKMLDTPPALLLFFQMIMGVISAGWGVVMATPLLVVIMTLVQELYMKHSTKNDEEEKTNENITK